MPDKRHHRGPHPEDGRLFSASQIPRLRRALHDYAWLLDHGYAGKSALTLVGDHFQLETRQRIAIARSACPREKYIQRQQRRAEPADLTGARILLDGYNVLTTVEAALAGGWVIAGMDGCLRDLASIHGSFKTVEETIPALELIGRTLEALRLSGTKWLLDRPVSNSGRLKTLIHQVATARKWNWEIELVASPDAVLSASDEVIATADSAVLDRCSRWFNLSAEVVRLRVPGAKILDLSMVVLGSGPDGV